MDLSRNLWFFCDQFSLLPIISVNNRISNKLFSLISLPFIQKIKVQSSREKLQVTFAECLTLLFQLIILSYVDRLPRGISFLWFKKVLEGEQYGFVVPWLKKEKNMRGKTRVRQSLEKWRLLLGCARSVCVCVSVWVNINMEMKHDEFRTG